MALIQVEPGLSVHCEVTDFLWPWTVATPVVMMHGFGRNGAIWNRWIPTLAADFRIYRPDMRGCGASDKPPPGSRFHVETLVQDFVKLLDQLGLERVHWVGESLGGLLGTLFAASHPERIASLVLCNTPVRVNATVKKDGAVDVSRPAEAILKYGTEEWSRRTMHGRLDQRWASPELNEWFIGQVAKTPAHVAAAMKDDCADVIDIEPVLKDVRAPVLILDGDEDLYATPEQQEMLRARLPSAKRRTFTGYAHGINLLLPQECAHATLDFLREVDESSGPVQIPQAANRS